VAYPAFDGFSPRELAGKLNVSRRQVACWLRHCWLREVNDKIPLDSLRRFCRAHPEQIPCGRLDPETQEWVRSIGYPPTGEDVQLSVERKTGSDGHLAGVPGDHQPEYA